MENILKHVKKISVVRFGSFKVAVSPWASGTDEPNLTEIRSVVSETKYDRRTYTSSYYVLI
jgi:hypothetical protein